MSDGGHPSSLTQRVRDGKLEAERRTRRPHARLYCTGTAPRGEHDRQQVQRRGDRTHGRTDQKRDRPHQRTGPEHRITGIPLFYMRLSPDYQV